MAKTERSNFTPEIGRSWWQAVWSGDGNPVAILVLGVVLLNCAALVLGLRSLEQSRQMFEAQAARTTQNIAQLLEQSLAAKVDLIDYSQQFLINELESQLRLGGTVTTQRINDILTWQTRHLGDDATTGVTDAQGRVIMGLGNASGEIISYADREFFKLHQVRPDAGLVVTNPIFGRASKRWVVAFTRRYNQADGQFAGVVSLAIPVEYFSRLLSSADLGPRGLALLRGSDTGLIARYPKIDAPAGQVGAKTFSSELRQILTSSQTRATFHSQHTGDGVERTNTYHRLSRPPFHLVVGTGIEDYLQPWYREVTKVVTSGIVFCTLTIGLAWLLGQALVRAKAQAQRNRMLLRSAGDGIHILDAQNNVQASSDAFCSMLGYERQEVASMNAGAWITAALPEPAQHFHPDQPLSREKQLFETRYRRKDGEIIDVEVSCDALTLAGQALRFYSARDITARKQAEQELQRLMLEQRSILQSDIVGFVKLHGRTMVWLNHAYAQMLGYTQEELSNQPTRCLYPDEASYRQMAESAYPVITAGQVFRRHLQYRRKDGNLAWFDVSGALMHEGSDESIWAFVDITAQKQVEAELIAARQAAEQASVAKSCFLATMSHEIRTPMNGILGMAQLLLSSNPDATHSREYARIILNSGQTLLSILNDVLDLSKVESGKLALEPVPFEPAQILNETRALFDASAAGKKLALYADCRCGKKRYTADAIRLRQMLANLLNNAIKFTHRGEIRLCCREVDKDEHTVTLEFSVSDTGIGIAAEKLRQIFEPFSQADNSISRQFGGTGLGLSIVRNLAELMGGGTGVESTPGLGSRFWFSIRAQRIPQGEDTRHGLRQSDGGCQFEPEVATLHGHVLVIEDNPINRMVIGAMLDKLGVSNILVESGQEGLDLLAGGLRPDVLLTDIHMPEMDGFEVTRCLREREQGEGKPRLTIVAQTADVSPSHQQEYRLAGMDDFIAKPIEFAKLRLVLQRWLKVGGTKPQLATPDVPPSASAGLADLLCQLRPQLEQQRFDALDTMKLLDQAAVGTPWAETICRAHQALEKFQFQTALERIQDINPALSETHDEP